MSNEEAFWILDMQKNDQTAGADKRARHRMKLADISNLLPNRRHIAEENNSQFTGTTMKEYIDQLQKENMALVTMLAQRDKTIEQTGAELDRLGVSFLRMQQQNQQLAILNSQMLAELNLGKERLKELQHELKCKSGLLNVLKEEFKEKERTNLCTNSNHEEEGVPLKETRDNKMFSKAEHTLKLTSSGTSEQLQYRKKIESKSGRQSARRKSAKFDVADLKPAGDPFDIDDAKVSAYPLLDDPLREKGSTSEIDLVKNEDNDDTFEQRYESIEHGRLSCSRPTREAARKVQSYKEPTINIKMRRP